MVNILNSNRPELKISKLLSLIGQPARIQIILNIGTQEICVCHLEVALGMRQASISQHLMALRKAGLVTTYRDGRNIFYHLTNPKVVDVLRQAAQLTGCSPEALTAMTASTVRPIPGCSCPQCTPSNDPKLICKNVSTAKSF